MGRQAACLVAGRFRRRQPAFRLARHQRGATALEFALVAPTALLVIFFALEIGVLMMVDATLTRVAADISRSMHLYPANPSGGDCTARVRRQLETGMRHWVYDSTVFRIQARTYAADDGALPTAGAHTVLQCDTAGPGGIVIYRVGFDRPGFSGVLGWLGLSVWRFERSILVQNER